MRTAIYILLRVVIVVVILLIAISTARAYSGEIREKAQEAGIDPDLAVAVAIVESGLRPEAVGTIGERGIFQLNPRFHAIVADESQNIDTAIAYLKQLKNRCVARYGDAWVVCYNYGPSRRLNEPTKTTYYKKVQRTYNQLRGTAYTVNDR